jgi:hypothetical protein
LSARGWKRFFDPPIAAHARCIAIQATETELNRRPSATTIQKTNRSRLVFFARSRQCWRGFRAWPRERHIFKPSAFGPADASLFSVFSGGHASVLEAISFAGAGLEAVGCGWQLL